jgi:alkanesulfonate monooxygenase SsuD/methylene tetrahydromethanopterin reductase-like flavin-dependent oxidoreductase (luciferase family)
MRTGIYLDLRNPPQWRRPWAEHYARSLELVERADALGIDSVWLTEHHLWEDGYLPQPLTLAAAVAARTRTMRIGTAVLLAPLRPAIDIAEQAAVVDLVSGGRLELGLGAGYVVPEFEAYGVSVNDRFALLEERVVEVDRLLRDGVVTPPPVQDRVPIWVGGSGRRAARLAGRTGSGLLWLDAEQCSLYLEAFAQSGHDVAKARIGGLANLVIVDDPEEAWSRIAPHLGYQWGSYAYYGRRGSDDRAGSVMVERRNVGDSDSLQLDPATIRSAGPAMTSPSADVVTPEEAVRRLSLWLGELPVEHVYFWLSIAGMPDDLVERHVELLATEVAPALRSIGAYHGIGR